MFDRKDITQLKKDIILDVELLNSRFKLHTRWGVFSPRSIDDGTLLLMKYIGANENDICLDLGCGYGPIGLALATAVWWGGDISGGHFNPAVSTMFYLDDKLTRNDLIPYVIAQVLGGAAALHFSKMVAKGY